MSRVDIEGDEDELERARYPRVLLVGADSPRGMGTDTSRGPVLRLQGPQNARDKMRLDEAPAAFVSELGASLELGKRQEGSGEGVKTMARVWANDARTLPHAVAQMPKCGVREFTTAVFDAMRRPAAAPCVLFIYVACQGVVVDGRRYLVLTDGAVDCVSLEYALAYMPSPAVRETVLLIDDHGVTGAPQLPPHAVRAMHVARRLHVSVAAASAERTLPLAAMWARAANTSGVFTVHDCLRVLREQAGAGAVVASEDELEFIGSRAIAIHATPPDDHVAAQVAKSRALAYRLVRVFVEGGVSKVAEVLRAERAAITRRDVARKQADAVAMAVKKNLGAQCMGVPGVRPHASHIAERAALVADLRAHHPRYGETGEMLERVRWVALVGDSGVGKTGLAMSAVHTVTSHGKANEFDAVVWCGARSLVELWTTFDVMPIETDFLGWRTTAEEAAAARRASGAAAEDPLREGDDGTGMWPRLGIRRTGQFFEGKRSARDVLRSLQDAAPDKCWLLVVDAADGGDALPLDALLPLLPQRGRGCVLLVSRQPGDVVKRACAACGVPKVALHTLQPVAREGANMVVRVYSSVRAVASSHAAVHSLLGMPGALELAGALIHKEGVALPHFARRFTAEVKAVRGKKVVGRLRVRTMFRCVVGVVLGSLRKHGDEIERVARLTMRVLAVLAPGIAVPRAVVYVLCRFENAPLEEVLCALFTRRLMLPNTPNSPCVVSEQVAIAVLDACGDVPGSAQRRELVLYAAGVVHQCFATGLSSSETSTDSQQLAALLAHADALYSQPEALEKPDTVLTLVGSDLARWLLAMGEVEPADRVLARVVREQDALGLSVAERVCVGVLAARLQLARGQVREAAEALRELYAESKDALRTIHMANVKAAVYLGCAELHLGNKEAAARVLSPVVDAYRAADGTYRLQILVEDFDCAVDSLVSAGLVEGALCVARLQHEQACTDPSGGGPTSPGAQRALLRRVRLLVHVPDGHEAELDELLPTATQLLLERRGELDALVNLFRFRNAERLERAGSVKEAREMFELVAGRSRAYLSNCVDVVHTAAARAQALREKEEEEQ